MALSVFRELVSSRSLSEETRSGTISSEWMLGQSSDEQEVYAELLAGTPPFYGILQRKRISLTPLGGGWWTGRVEYGPSEGQAVDAANAGGDGGLGGQGGSAPAEPGPNDPLGFEFSFDTTGGTSHITQSANTVSRTKSDSVIRARSVPSLSVQDDTPVVFFIGSGSGFSSDDIGAEFAFEGVFYSVPPGTTITDYDPGPPGFITLSANVVAFVAGDSSTTEIGRVISNDAPNHRGAIGVSKNGVAGCDITAPRLEFSITRPLMRVTLAYIKKLRDLTGTVNRNSYFGFDTCELLFLGAQGSGALDKPPRATFRFAAEKNKTDIYISSNLTVPAKKGWEYLWVAYEDSLDGQVVTRPAAAYVEEVYGYSDFADLGI